MHLDPERCYRAVAGRDPRFDGVFYLGVRTTGIYCRPSCPAPTPRRENAEFYPSAAAAQAHGLRTCRRCRPDAVPGSPQWHVRGDVVARLVGLIEDGAVDREGVAGVAGRLGYSARHLNRLAVDELGAGVLALARTHRAQAARTLMETTDLPAADVAWAAGFGSVRSFNDTVRTVYGVVPGELRRARRGRHGRAPVAGTPVTGTPVAGTPIEVRLAARLPYDAVGALAFLGTRAVPGVESWDGTAYRRSMALPHGHATVSVRPDPRGVRARFVLADLRDLTAAVARVRRMLDMDADPHAIAELLGADPVLAGPVAARPGLRVPGVPDPFEALVRAIVGQQVSTTGARTVLGRIVAAHGAPLGVPDDELAWAFPPPEHIACIDPATLPMPGARAATLVSVGLAVAEGSLVLDPSVDREATRAALAEFRGIGPWTTGYVAMRGLSDPDVLLAKDLGVRRAVAALGDQGALLERQAPGWAPWRSYAMVHLWASLDPGPATGTGATR